MDARIRMVRAAMKGVLLVISLGILMMWVIMPTQTYREKWRIKINQKVYSTYLGTSGSNILIWTFPMLFISVLGSLYLHLGKKLTKNDVSQSSDDGEGHRRAVTWKKPVLVKGPVGIVTATELAFLIMFTALLVWSLSTELRRGFANITPFAQQGERTWVVKLKITAFYLGIVGNICLAFLFFPVTRGSSVLPLLGLTPEGSIKYHIWLGHMVMALFTAHGFGYILVWSIDHQFSEMIQWKMTGISNLAGEISLLGGLGLWITTLPRIRRKAFELFFYTHYLYIIFVIFFILHVGINYSFIMLPGFYLFVIDRYLRLLQSQQKVRLVSARVLPCNTLELNFSKSPDLSYNPTSIFFVNVPRISGLQWHPFTISSSSNLEPDSISVLIKTEGSWSRKLYDMVSSPSIDRLEIALEGPYGPASTHFLRHDKLVMVSGGSGITPFISIIRELLHLSKTSKCRIPKLVLICAFKKSSDLTWLDLIMPISDTTSGLSNLPLQIEAYITRDKARSTDNSKKVHSVWFKPLPTDEPVSAILGPNSWLWLAAIISSSFIIFLILIGIITKYYIYPIDRNKNLYSYFAKASLYMLFICASITATASAAVFLNRRKIMRETRQIQNTEGPMQAGTQEKWFHNANRELESLPQQYILDATNVHYGKRPNLKKILPECEGSSVGVLVSGPTKMRHEVATICSSGLLNNFHFESISFNW
ncbi:hypothetical protein SLEP1_g2365 [Rubroshorea leprosula]|uniref:ferric-chelate reductase (NADH) n=1 Tax=Rubroshorea leprosula TaxID=152421 RepID=A0AAV5HRF1_9ROSI|nr:hypothetical protein SLEP1_g2365 [Rubroshorea leprosula]